MELRAARRQQGFTLIEIMVVVVILGILAAIVAPQVISRIDDAQIERARTDIRVIAGALQMYRIDNFRYPNTDEGLEALITAPPDARKFPKGGYLEQKGVPNDPWQSPYQYMSPGQNGEFDVFTLGADAQPGGEGINADIGNWDLN